jgi:hypothetical protein
VPKEPGTHWVAIRRKIVLAWIMHPTNGLLRVARTKVTQVMDIACEPPHPVQDVMEMVRGQAYM